MNRRKQQQESGYSKLLISDVDNSFQRLSKIFTLPFPCDNVRLVIIAAGFKTKVTKFWMFILADKLWCFDYFFFSLVSTFQLLAHSKQ